MNAPTTHLRPRTSGYLSCLAFSLFLATVAQGWRVILACGSVLALTLVFFRGGFKPLARARLWLFLAFLFLPPVFLGPSVGRLGPIGFSREGLLVGAQISLRAITVLVAVNGFAASVSLSDLTSLLERAGFRGLGFALGVALHMLPLVQETISSTWQALRMRGGFRRRRLRALRLLLITIIVNTLRYAEDIIDAAESRAFSTSRSDRLR